VSGWTVKGYASEYTLTQLAELVEDKQLRSDMRVRHPTQTSGVFVFAFEVPELESYFAEIDTHDDEEKPPQALVEVDRRWKVNPGFVFIIAGLLAFCFVAATRNEMVARTVQYEIQYNMWACCSFVLVVIGISRFFESRTSAS
jgi:uncharacterized membrane protein